jgi:hypothetical protein
LQRQRFLSGGSGLLPSVEAGNNTPTFRNLFMRILGIDESQSASTVPAPPPPPPDTNVLATNPTSNDRYDHSFRATLSRVSEAIYSCHTRMHACMDTYLLSGAPFVALPTFTCWQVEVRGGPCRLYVQLFP